MATTTDLAYTFNDLKPSTCYYAYVTAENGLGEGYVTDRAQVLLTTPYDY